MNQPKSDLVSRIKEGLQQDPLAKDLLEKVLKGKTMRFWQEEGILLTKEDRLFVPRRENLRKEVIKECHDSKWAGYPRIERTTALVQASYFWPHMRERYRGICANLSCVPVRQGGSSTPSGIIGAATTSNKAMRKCLHGLHHITTQVQRLRKHHGRCKPIQQVSHIHCHTYRLQSERDSPPIHQSHCEALGISKEHCK